LALFVLTSAADRGYLTFDPFRYRTFFHRRRFNGRKAIPDLSDPESRRGVKKSQNSQQLAHADMWQEAPSASDASHARIYTQPGHRIATEDPQ